jgi:hypothetical protein
LDMFPFLAYTNLSIYFNLTEADKQLIIKRILF